MDLVLDGNVTSADPASLPGHRRLSGPGAGTSSDTIRHLKMTRSLRPCQKRHSSVRRTIYSGVHTALNFSRRRPKHGTCNFQVFLHAQSRLLARQLRQTDVLGYVWL